jgi:hypothetical protein
LSSKRLCDLLRRDLLALGHGSLKQDARSIDDQLRRCREFAERSGYDVVGEYHDEAISGTHMERAQLRKMIQAATAPSAARSAL